MVVPGGSGQNHTQHTLLGRVFFVVSVGSTENTGKKRPPTSCSWSGESGPFRRYESDGVFFVFRAFAAMRSSTESDTFLSVRTNTHTNTQTTSYRRDIFQRGQHAYKLRRHTHLRPFDRTGNFHNRRDKHKKNTIPTHRKAFQHWRQKYRDWRYRQHGGGGTDASRYTENYQHISEFPKRE